MDKFFTWRIVSKLKVKLLHRVNSPLAEPVIRRRPSGVNCIFFLKKRERKKKK